VTIITELGQAGDRPTLTELPSDAGFEPPTEGQFKALVEIVCAAHPPTRRFIDENTDAERMLWLSFAAVGHMFRKPEPDTTKYFSSHVEAANAVLRRRWGMSISLDPLAVMAAIIGHNDVAYRLANNKVGQPLEVALDPFFGMRCSNAWRDVLAGRPLKPPLPPRFSVEKTNPMQVYLQGR
jgi:hypothetical protein